MRIDTVSQNITSHLHLYFLTAQHKENDINQNKHGGQRPKLKELIDWLRASHYMSTSVFSLHNTHMFSLSDTYTHTQSTAVFGLVPLRCLLAGAVRTGKVSLTASADVRLPARFQAITARHVHSLSRHLLTPTLTLALADRHTHPDSRLHMHQLMRWEHGKCGTTTAMNGTR